MNSSPSSQLKVGRANVRPARGAERHGILPWGYSGYLRYLDQVVWVDYIVRWGVDEADSQDTLYDIFSHLEAKDVFAAVHKCLFLDTKKISCCGRVFSGEQVTHSPERLQGWGHTEV